ncbi:MAG: rRNA cytosine-C5-methyltransferase [Tannerellaceae bacterium]|jgi:16S rRNA C967 or C1407 C5-methylase (RsmB/RsmF family)/NOL1/NOP2/fmu family ribosome biogenesis protein|nr:rRNA cytosine-C5-methyltransferase [Tannerellaceae bacterium]
MLPTDFIIRSRDLLGGEYESFEAALRGEATVSVRINRDKCRRRPEGVRVPWCETGYYLPERLPFTFDPMLHAGAYYVQEASSMFLEQAIAACVEGPVRCLDLCAAPGGKSTHLAAMLPEGSLLVSNEVIRSRAQVLVENLAKWGKANVIVSRNDPVTIGRLTAYFDLILADLPCSGEGMFRKDPAGAAQWSLANVSLCSARQRRIVHDIWNALKPGGVLIYSTCTFNLEENEENVDYIVNKLGAESLPVHTLPGWQVGGAMRYGHSACRFFPHKTRGEGFFLSILRKTAGDVSPHEIRRSRAEKGRAQGKGKGASSDIPQEVRDRLLDPGKFHIARRGNIIQAIPRVHVDDYRFLSGHLDILAGGISVGEIKGEDLLPAHSLAMSSDINAGAFALMEVSREEALSYLRKETLDRAGERGYALVTYGGLPLGFVKQLGNRSNNLYPQEWRIRNQRKSCSTTLISPSLGAGSNPSSLDIIR